MKRFCKRKKCDNEFTLTESEKTFDAVVSDFYGLVNNLSKDLAKRHGITSDQVDYILRKHFEMKQAKKLI